MNYGADLVQEISLSYPWFLISHRNKNKLFNPVTPSKWLFVLAYGVYKYIDYTTMQIRFSQLILAMSRIRKVGSRLSPKSWSCAHFV